jgi:hypothetical protein
MEVREFLISPDRWLISFVFGFGSLSRSEEAIVGVGALEYQYVLDTNWNLTMYEKVSGLYTVTTAGADKEAHRVIL